MNTFAIDVPLPPGPLFVEASAGTGKTWSIARLVARLLAEEPIEGGEPPRIEQILVVTFTNAATAELGDRIRALLATAVAELQRVQSKVADELPVAADQDPGLALLAGHGVGQKWRPHPLDVLQLRIDRLKRAVRDFDSASITTIHSFCQQALARLAFESGTDFDRTPFKQVNDLVGELVDDWLAAELVHVTDVRHAWWFEEVGLNRERLLKIAHERLGLRSGRFLPPRPTSSTTWRQEVDAGEAPAADATRWFDEAVAEFAEHVHAEFNRRLARNRWVTFDSMLQEVADGTEHPPFVAGLRAKFKVALIDEFQDTDGVQWQIFQKVFLADPGARLVLIGDPKQAIYGFRTADLRVYAAARDAVPADRRFTMRQNFRSDAQLIEALNRSLVPGPALLGFDDIPVEEVAASFDNRLRTAQGELPAPLVLRWYDGRHVHPPTDALLSNSDAAKALPELLARDLAAELKQGWLRKTETGERPVQANDFAVLTAMNYEAFDIRDALLAVGVPAVVARSGAVFDAVEAVWLRTWLLALDGGEGELRRLAVTPLFAWTGQQLLNARQGEDEQAGRDWLAMRELLHRQSKLLQTQGVVAAFAALLYTRAPADHRSPLERLASRAAGEVHLTNLRHLVELLDATARSQRLQADGLARWLLQRREQTDDNEAHQLRLESDEAAVKITTLHSSKGLEFPIVYVTSLADGRLMRGKAEDIRPRPIRFHAGQDTHWTVDLRGLQRADLTHAVGAARELQEERLRLQYVALTRGVHRVVVYGSAPTGSVLRKGMLPQDFRVSPLAAWLHGTTGSGNRLDRAAPVVEALLRSKSTATVSEAVKAACDQLGAPIFELVEAQDGTTPGSLPGGQMPAEAPAVFRRNELDTLWRRESYTGLVRHRTGRLAPELEPHDGGLRQDDDELPTAPGDDPDDDVLEAAATPATLDIADPEDAVPAEVADVPLRGFFGGAEAGTWVHGVLETLSFGSAQPKDGRPLAELVRTHGQRNGFTDPARDALLCEALPQMLATPLGPATGGLQLASVADGDRLDELKFDLPIGSGAGEQVAAAALMQAMGAARTDDPMPPGYLAHVRTMTARALSGYLTGAIDLVFRAEVAGRPQWFVVDYKTNQLGPRVEGRIARSTAGHYTGPWLQREMARKHYYVQYMLYLTALHRYLQARLPGYDYDRDVGGALYLFVRGMLGADTPCDARGQPAGVYFDKPPRGHIEQLSRLLSAEAPCS
jgi:exodeoxyribonuclease V beta subunit